MKRLLVLSLLIVGSAGAQPEEWSRPFPGHRIVGDLYSVGTWDLGCFLIVSDEGHVLVNSGLEDSTAMIRANVESLGFRLEDVRVLLTMQAHWDHAAALAEIREIAGAEMWATAGDAPLLESGGLEDPLFGGELGFRAVPVDRILKDGEVVRLGAIRLTVVETPGHTVGSSTYLMTTSDGGREYRVALANLGSINPGTGLRIDATYPGIADDYEKTFRRQKAMEVDVWVAAHASQYGLHDKFQPGDPHDPERFVDPEGFEEAVRRYERLYEEALAAERR